eukprot:Sspe_Gene.12682::Locus_4333_Transcript_1_1_Confidence_1.000_Length_2083::g.12682::m.12682
MFSWLEALAPSAGDLLFMEAWNKRLGTTGLRPAEMYWYSETQLKQPASLIPTIVEQDSWRYNTTRYGKPTVGGVRWCAACSCATCGRRGACSGTSRRRSTAGSRPTSTTTR